MPHHRHLLLIFTILAFVTSCTARHGNDLFMPLLFEQHQLPEIPRQLPRYWHDHLKKVAVGLHKQHTFEPVSDEALYAHFDSYIRSISGVCLYVPPGELTCTEPIVFFVVHGTWARGSLEFYDPTSAVFQDTLLFAQDLAQRLARPIEVVSFEWEGQDAPESRAEGGRDLRNLIESFYAPVYGYGPIWGYGHSHGGNVYNIASQDVCFDTLIYCGTPVHDMYRPSKVRRLFLFYSTSDAVQKAGSFDRRTLSTFFKRTSNGRVYPQQEDQRVVNIRIQFDGEGPAHLSLKWIMQQLWGLIDVVDRRYHYHTHLDANIYSGPDPLEKVYEEPIVTIREQLSLHEVLPRIRQGDGGALVAQQLSSELAYSGQQEQRFSAKYHGRSIHDTSSFISQITMNWREAVDTLYYMIPWLPFADDKFES